jgi:hypothetical protein
MMSQICFFNFSVGEISCPAKYFEDASSITFRRSVVYGLGVLITSFKYRLQKWGFIKSTIFDAQGSKLSF